MSAFIDTPVGQTVVEVLSAVLFVLAGRLIHAFTSKVKNDDLRAVLELLRSAVLEGVKAQQQRVPELKAKNGGKLSLEDARELRNEATSAALRFLGEEGSKRVREALNKSPVELQRVIDTLIESSVTQVKGPNFDDARAAIASVP